MTLPRLLLLLLLAAPASTFALPTEIDAQYQITTAGIPIGHVTESFRRAANRYRIESTTRPEGLLGFLGDMTVALKSEGRVLPAGLQPARFEQRRSDDASRTILATFDWEAALLRSQYRGESRTSALPPGTQDRASILYQFMFIPEAGNEVRVHMSNGRRVTRYVYRKAGEETLVTPAGAFATVHYERVTESERENRADIWLAKDRFHLAVRVVFEDTHGLQLEQNLVSLATR